MGDAAAEDRVRALDAPWPRAPECLHARSVCAASRALGSSACCATGCSRSRSVLHSEVVKGHEAPTSRRANVGRYATRSSKRPNICGVGPVWCCREAEQKSRLDGAVWSGTTAPRRVTHRRPIVKRCAASFSRFSSLESFATEAKTRRSTAHPSRPRTSRCEDARSGRGGGGDTYPPPDADLLTVGQEHSRASRRSLP